MTARAAAIDGSAHAGAVSPVEDVIEAMRNGRMVILVDAEDRENEGDLVIAAQMATPDAVNFMAKHGRGLICLALTESRARDLSLEAMSKTNGSRNRTAFTKSIEAREGVSTGISARDRAITIATAIDPAKGAADLVSPGHVFPLVAREGGVLVRAGHTEGSVDLARLAGLNPAAVICEIMNDDGTMARLPDLVAFAQRHGLKIGAIDALIAYRLRKDRIVRRTARAGVETAFGGAFDLYVYETSVAPGEHIALVKGDLSKPGPVLVRVHAVDEMADLLRVGPGDAADSLIEKAIRAIAAEGQGAIVIIRNRYPTAISSWIAKRRSPASRDLAGRDRRQVDIGIGSQILQDLGVTDMTLLTNSPPSVYAGAEAFGLRISGSRAIG